MSEAARHKKKGEFDAAINLLRQAIETYPKDIEPYLESGRLYVRKKEYGRALSRFSQAEELFMDAPAPNQEIGAMRLTQVKEKIEAGADPADPEITAWVNEAVANYQQAHAKAVEVAGRVSGDQGLSQDGNIAAIGQELLKWDLGELLGAGHPAVKDLFSLVEQTTEGLDKMPIEQLTGRQCVSLGLLALEKGDLINAKKYYFQGLKDRERFAEVCTEVNLMGIRLRSQGLVDDALAIYKKLLAYKPPNQGSVYWNMAVACAQKKDHLGAAGYAARCLYVDPALPREKEFYSSLTPALIPVVVKVMKMLRLVVGQQKKIKPPAGLMKMYALHDRLRRHIAAGEKAEALKLFLYLQAKAARFVQKPEFLSDPNVSSFLEEIGPLLSRHKDPRRQASAKAVQTWLRLREKNPVPPRLAQCLELYQAAFDAVDSKGDQHEAAFFLGQALILTPEAYLARPDLFARETLPGLAREMAGKFKHVDPKRFPQPRRQAASAPKR